MHFNHNPYQLHILAQTNLTETFLKCEDEIQSACDPSNLPQPNMTEVKTCNAAIEIFKKKSEGCIKKSGELACSCWTDKDIEKASKTIKKCDCK